MEEDDAFYGNDDEKYKDVPEVDVVLEEHLDLWKRRKLCPQKKWQMLCCLSAARSFHGGQEVGGSSESSSTRILSQWLEWVLSAVCTQ